MPGPAFWPLRGLHHLPSRRLAESRLRALQGSGCSGVRRPLAQRPWSRSCTPPPFSSVLNRSYVGAGRGGSKSNRRLKGAGERPRGFHCPAFKIRVLEPSFLGCNTAGEEKNWGWEKSRRRERSALPPRPGAPFPALDEQRVRSRRHVTRPVAHRLQTPDGKRRKCLLG